MAALMWPTFVYLIVSVLLIAYVIDKDLRR